MDQNQSFNLPNNFLEGFPMLFIKLVLVIIIVYVSILILNFLKDKFIAHETTTKHITITDLFTILNKLFFFSGIGFVLGTLAQHLFFTIKHSGQSFSMTIGNNNENISFGIILIFMGIGFKMAKKILKKEHLE
tara:strand:- start:2333 stop:2731 length:399 start_codon:yes stop_codon:yes gene_type:complete